MAALKQGVFDFERSVQVAMFLTCIPWFVVRRRFFSPVPCKKTFELKKSAEDGGLYFEGWLYFRWYPRVLALENNGAACVVCQSRGREGASFPVASDAAI